VSFNLPPGVSLSRRRRGHRRRRWTQIGVPDRRPRQLPGHGASAFQAIARERSRC
jgi:hypothetical protein